MNNLYEQAWDGGWIPSSGKDNLEGNIPKGLLRMDNLTLEEKGNIRLIKPPKMQSEDLFNEIASIYGTPFTFKITETTITPGVLKLTTDLAILIDKSDSISAADLVNEKSASCGFVDAFAPLDGAGGIMVISFGEVNGDVDTAIATSHTTTTIKTAINAIVGGGYTPLYNAIYVAANTTGIKNIILMTDGVNSAGTHTLEQAITAARKNKIKVYCIGFGAADNDILNQISDSTGGLYYPVGTSGYISAAITAIGNIVGTDTTTEIIKSFDNVKLRYVYNKAGKLVRNYADENGTLENFGLTIFENAISPRCAFLTAMNKTLCIAGDKKYVDDGATQYPLGINKPNSPTLVAQATVVLDVTNLDGGDIFTNWADISTATGSFDNTGIPLYFKTNPGTLQGIVKSIYSGNKDMSNLGGTGKDTAYDKFTMGFISQDPASFQWVLVEFWCANGDHYYKQWFANDFNSLIGNINCTCTRGDFTRIGTNDNDSWANIAYVVVTTGCTNPYPPATSFSSISGLSWFGGAESNLTGTFQYAVVGVNNTGDSLNFSKVSTETAELKIDQQSIEVSLDTAGLDTQINELWFFRKDLDQGDYLLIKSIKLTDYAPFKDYMLTEDALSAAILDPDNAILQVSREDLPDDIIGMIWFSDRVIYLTKTSFMPSYKYDPNTYDSRFVYELNGIAAEQCLFIAKLDVGYFIVATTKDFYRVSGSFGIISDGLLDVNIYPLGVSDPAISSQFIEFQGSIYYISTTGIRILNNGISTLMNGALDLLFRGESRYGTLAADLTNDSKMSFATKGNRLYFSLDNERIFVLDNGIFRLIDLSLEH